MRSHQNLSYLINGLIVIKTLICKISPNPPPNLSLPKGGITPIWQRRARGDFLMTVSIQF